MKGEHGRVKLKGDLTQHTDLFLTEIFIFAKKKNYESY